jgi:hypothetical protein
MVTNGSSQNQKRCQRGSLTAEVMVALAILTAVMIPLVTSSLQDQKHTRELYLRAVAMEIVDGEIEVLAAGAWRAFEPGEHSYSVTAQAAANLPPGKFIFTRTEKTIRLEWQPDDPVAHRHIRVAREARLP